MPEPPPLFTWAMFSVASGFVVWAAGFAYGMAAYFGLCALWCIADSLEGGDE